MSRNLALKHQKLALTDGCCRFFVPISIFLGDPQISVGYYIWKSMIPSLLGNIVGGGLMVGVMYWYLVRQHS